jgi:hypothetical protein
MYIEDGLRRELLILGPERDTTRRGTRASSGAVGNRRY